MEWQKEKLGKICRIELGKTPSRSNKKLWDEAKEGKNVWLSIADLPHSLKPIISDSKEYISEEGRNICKLVPKGTLILSFKLSIGRLAFTGRDLYTNEAIAALYIGDSALLLQDYLYWYLKFFDWDNAVGNDVKVKGKTLNKAKLKEIDVFFPPIEEQKRIVTILDQVFADIEKARATAETNLKNADELFDSYLQQVFSQRGEGWVDTSLGNICNFQNGYAFKSKDTVETSNTQLIRMGNLYQNILDLNRKSVFYPDNFSDEYEQFKLKEGDMIISLTGTVGKEDYGYTVEIPRTDKTLLLNQRIAKIISIDIKKLDKRFLLRTLRSRVFLDKLYSTANGTRQANLSTTTMKDILIGIPSLDKQLELCRDFDKLEVETLKLTRIYSKKLVDLDELKKSILQKAFTGELTKSKGIAA